MKKTSILFGLFLAMVLVTSCIGTKDVRYLQENENLEINSEGLVSYNIPIYRVTKNDILALNIITTPKGDAAQFYSSYNVSGGAAEGMGNMNPGLGMAGVGSSGGTGGGTNSGTMTGGNGNYYFRGLKVDSKGDINVFGIGFIKAEGRTLEDISNEIQSRVNANFLGGKSEVRLNLDGIRYYILGDVETVEITGEKVAYKQTLTITEALAINGGLNRTVDRKNVVLHRKLPEGIKIVKLDLTRKDVMNSQYYWLQNGDEIYLNTRGKNLSGFGKEPLQNVAVAASLITSALSVYLLFSKL